MTWGWRRYVLLAATGVLILALVGQLAYMQLIRAGYYRRIANDNRIRVVRLAAPRGKILDRHSIELAGNRQAFSIAVVPADFSGTTPRERLAHALDMVPDDLANRLTRRRTLPLEPVAIRRDVDLRMISRLEERVEEFSGVILSTEPVREYAATIWGGHLLGYVRDVSERDQQRSDKVGGPLRGQIGATGLEHFYDDLLRGVDGIGYREMNAYGQMMGPMPGYTDVQPIPGDDIRLAIDWELQELADSLLAKYLAGTVVALDVRTGGVLCFVTRPGFDANRFVGEMSTAEWSTLRDDPRHPLLNRATMGLYPPGSVSKLATAAAGLEAGVVNAGQRFAPCNGGYQFGNRWFGCWNAAGHGALPMAGAIEQSCDVYFYQLAQRLTLEQWSVHMMNCGFGRPTGLDLPAEKAGIVPSREYYDRIYGKGKWSRGLMLNLAIGQGELTVTPMQLAVYFAALANDGTAMKPHLVAAQRAPGGVWVERTPEAAFRLPCSPATLRVLQDACRRVVTAEHGTAHAIADERVRMAGKTGTAQNPHGEDHAWFASWAPADRPQIAIVALVENVGHGSTFAAPICYQIARAYLGVPPKTREPLAVN
ncbi:MAG TPA: penicillin-binding protein 2 [Acidobacteriota bacterium]|nr:penicillin-binding protein 2 [Acidobacteriota bacterium]